jgi:hypothetical protein
MIFRRVSIIVRRSATDRQTVSGDICGSRIAMSVRYQSSNQFVPKAPLCAGCAQIMRLSRDVFGRLDKNLPD